MRTVSFFIASPARCRRIRQSPSCSAMRAFLSCTSARNSSRACACRLAPSFMLSVQLAPIGAPLVMLQSCLVVVLASMAAKRKRVRRRKEITKTGNARVPDAGRE